MSVLFNAVWKSEANINVRLRSIQGVLKFSDTDTDSKVVQEIQFSVQYATFRQISPE